MVRSLASKRGTAMALFRPALAAAMAACLGTAAQAGGSRDLRELACEWGFGEPIIEGDDAVLTNEFTRVQFLAGSRKVDFNGVLVWLHEPFVISQSGLLLVRQDIDDVMMPLMRPDSVVASRGYSLVMLDAGHGGEDDGACAPGGAREKDIALDIAKRVKRKLRGSRIKVRMTRDGDRYLTLEERAEKTNRAKADLLVSIHLNSAPSSTVSGFETFVLTSPGCASTAGERADQRSFKGTHAAPAGLLLGYYVQRGLVLFTDGEHGEDRGVKHARFQVLKNTTCPSVLVEGGFVSNPRERARLMDPEYRDTVAEGIARGILTYISRVRNAGAVLDSAR